MRNFKIGSGEAAMRFNGDDESAPVTWNGETSFSLTQKGLVLPNVATASLVADPPDGTVVYDTTASKPKWYNGSSYQEFGGSGAVDEDTGTWTPNLWDSSNSSSEGQANATQVGLYSKIGTQVTVDLNLLMTSYGTLSTSQGLRIGPLPYTAITASGYEACGSIGSVTGLDADINLAAVVTSNTNYITLRKHTHSSGAYANFIATDATQPFGLTMSVTYRTAS